MCSGTHKQTDSERYKCEHSDTVTCVRDLEIIFNTIIARTTPNGFHGPASDTNQDQEAKAESDLCSANFTLQGDNVAFWEREGKRRAAALATLEVKL